MEIRERREGTLAVLELSGRFTVADAAGRLKGATTAAIDGGARHVVLDLSRLTYIDSTRLGELIAVHITLARTGGRLALAGVPERIVDLLTLAGLDGVFERFATIEDARRHFS